jgi:TolA-binding protein
MNAKRKLPLLVIVALGALCLGVVVALGRHRQEVVVPQDPSEGAERETEPPAASMPVPVPAPAPVPVSAPVMAGRPSPAAAPAPAITESALMAAIRDLGASDPARALELARDGNRRFPKSADAAERSWTICKSLAALGRFNDAQVEARLLVHQYPDTTWAGDVTRHLLTQPLEDPSQRGYGKSSELD